MFVRVYERIRLPMVAVAGLPLILTGCAAINPKPFAEFQDGALHLGPGTSVLLPLASTRRA